MKIEAPSLSGKYEHMAYEINLDYVLERRTLKMKAVI